MRFASYTKLVKDAVKTAILKRSPAFYFGARGTLLPSAPELALVEGLADPKRDAVDVGAHFGMWTHALAQRFRHVHAFEPLPRLADVLRGPQRANVSVHEVALSRTRGEATLRMPVAALGHERPDGRSPLASLFDPNGAMVEVQVARTRLDDYGLAEVGFMRIDAEGQELDVLDGAQAARERARPALVIEVGAEDRDRTTAHLARQLGALGYRAFGMAASSLHVILLQPDQQARLDGAVRLEPLA
jgi:FkbM family methyltransferase